MKIAQQSFIAACLIVLIVGVSSSYEYGSWTQSSTNMPVTRAESAVGFSSTHHVAWILGGYGSEKYVMLFNVTSKSFTDYTYDENHLSLNIAGKAQFYTQIEEYVYMINNAGFQIIRFNMDLGVQDSFVINVPQIVYHGGYTAHGDQPCLASVTQSGLQYLFVVGGTEYYGQSSRYASAKHNLQILNLNDNTWSNGPNMTIPRGHNSCITNKNGDKLYTIGGWTDDGADTVEMLNISNVLNISNQWVVLPDLLSPGMGQTRAVLNGKDIVIVGGWAFDAGVSTNIIDTFTDTIIVSGSLYTQVSGTTPVVDITTRIAYAFGGTIGFMGSVTPSDIWQYVGFPPNSETFSYWVQGSTTLPRATCAAAIGYSSDTIWIVGGISTQSEFSDYKQVVSFNITNSEFVDYGETKLPQQFFGGFIQIEQYLYAPIHATGSPYIWKANMIHRFNVETGSYDYHWESSVPYITGNYACLSGVGIGGGYLFVAGGEYINTALNSFHMLNLSSRQWSAGSGMNYARYRFGCIVNTNKDKLYAIGGYTGDSANTVEVLNITNLSDINNQGWS
eukprot:267875_1